MILNDNELATTQTRILEFQRILAQLRVAARPEEFNAVTGGYLHELERMQDDVLDYLRHHSSEWSRREQPLTN
jgi:hypothetical protein